ncbi:hypothetical protein V1477_010907 [Vespula maculifrons]|uniref:Uncharacterized protein n=1 Tax=Vespula maculifrons TaxID=7453 RepID=A0ABD2C548_VESMC
MLSLRRRQKSWKRFFVQTNTFQIYIYKYALDYFISLIISYIHTLYRLIYPKNHGIFTKLA